MLISIAKLDNQFRMFETDSKPLFLTRQIEQTRKELGITPEQVEIIAQGRCEPLIDGDEFTKLYNEMPKELQELVESDSLDYQDCEKICNYFLSKGIPADYYLDAVPYIYKFV